MGEGDISELARKQGRVKARSLIEDQLGAPQQPSANVKNPKIVDFDPDQENKPKYKLSGRTIFDFLDINIDPETNILGNRFLTKTSGLFLISPSGHGKSSMTVHFIICFAIGRVAFGIKPAKALRILCIQSEDDDADTKKFTQVIRKMNLSEAEKALLSQNTRFEYRNNLHGNQFVAALDAFLTEWYADIVIINPLSGFLLGDLKDEDRVSEFLRARLTPLLTKHKCGAIIIHHTPKTNFAKLDNMQWYDWMYAMSGCASLTNWARAALVLAPSKIPGTYRLIAAKRFDEIQWTEREYWFSHSKDKISVNGQQIDIIEWIPAGEDEIKSAKPSQKAKKRTPSDEEVLSKMPPLSEYTRPMFRQWLSKDFQLGEKKADTILDSLADKGLLEIRVEQRPRTNPLKWYSKTK
jgi:hypothetical protein